MIHTFTDFNSDQTVKVDVDSGHTDRTFGLAIEVAGQRVLLTTVEYDKVEKLIADMQRELKVAREKAARQKG